LQSAIEDDKEAHADQFKNLKQQLKEQSDLIASQRKQMDELLGKNEGVSH